MDSSGTTYWTYTQTGTAYGTIKYVIKASLTLKINPVVVTVKSHSATKPYDDTPLTCKSYDLECTSSAPALNITWTGTVTDVTTEPVPNTFDASVRGSNANNYYIRKQYGTLEITDKKYHIYLKAEEKTVNYDGQEHDVTSADPAKFEVWDGVKGAEGSKQIVSSGVRRTSTVDGSTVETMAVINTARVSADPVDNPHSTDPNNPTVTPDPKSDTAEDETVDPDPSLVLDKTATNYAQVGAYQLGDWVEYEITATDDGNLDLENVVVTDDLTGQSWTIAKLAVGANATFTTSYVITEADIIRGTVVNVATGDGDSPDGSDPEIIPDDETVTPDDPNPSFTLEKTVVNVPERGYFYEGETARYIVTVVNDGNLTLSEMTLTELLEGAKFEPGAGYTVSADGKTAIIDTMKPGERIDVAAAYTVKFEDNLTGLTNIVTGKAKGPGGDPSDPENPNGPTDNPKLDPPEKTADEPTPTDEMIDVTGGKTWLDHDNAYGTRPESITVRLMANGEQKDEMTVSEATGWRYSFTGLHKHDKAGNAIAYTVVEDAVTGYDTTYPAEGGVVNALKKFKVTVNHWYEKVGGELVTDPIVAEYEYGQPYDISCIRVPGHKPDKQRVSGTVTGDVTIDFVYIAIPYKLTIYYIYYEDGSTAAPTHEEILYYGDEFRVQSPDISGYLATEATVFGTMGEHDLVYTIIYVPWRNKRGSSSGTGASAPAAPATPVNLTHIDLNVGDCFE